MDIQAMNRENGRQVNELRDFSFTRNYLDFAEGSCLVTFGRTKVICAASIEDRVPPFLLGTGQGWITAEYSLLPKSTKQRINREKSRGGRSQEIQRLIGRSMRSVMNLDLLNERTIYIDCDVIQADGGTRAASISGATVALHDALSFMDKNNLISEWPMSELVAAISVGLVDGNVCLDLDYSEDSVADVDFNVVKTQSGDYVEIQGTAENSTFTKDQLLDLLSCADQGIEIILQKQKEILEID
jgi:ribonuclease PH